MQRVTLVPVQAGFPGSVPELVGLAGTLVLLLFLVAIVGFAYKSLTGGVEWPTDKPDDEAGLREGDEDDEWDYY